MKNRFEFQLCIKLLFLILLPIAFACSPVIKSFEITDTSNTITRTIGAKDSLLLKWKVYGKPTLMCNIRDVIDSTANSSIDSDVKILEYTLIASKWGKQVRKLIQVTQLPQESIDSITFMTAFNQTRDTLFAIGTKNIERWGNKFQILTAASNCNRHLIVKHAGRSVQLTKDGLFSNELEGTPIEGDWVFCCALTEAERLDASTLPEFLQIKVKIQYKKR